MTKVEVICKRIKESADLKYEILEDQNIIDQLAALASNMIETIDKGGKIIFAGNGGSFSDSIHLAAEFISRFQIERDPLAAIALGANNAIITAIGNDYSYEEIFERELKGLGKEEDLLVVISTSGNSKNIIRVVQTARNMNIEAYCLTGEGGGELSDYHECIMVPSKLTARIQECHILFGHILCELVEQSLTNQHKGI